MMVKKVRTKYYPNFACSSQTWHFPSLDSEVIAFSAKINVLLMVNIQRTKKVTWDSQPTFLHIFHEFRYLETDRPSLRRGATFQHFVLHIMPTNMEKNIYTVGHGLIFFNKFVNLCKLIYQTSMAYLFDSFNSLCLFLIFFGSFESSLFSSSDIRPPLPYPPKLN